MSNAVGALVNSRHVVCLSCADEYPSPAPLFAVNCGQYAVTCHDCGGVVLPGQEGWPELFPVNDCRTCPKEEYVYA